MWFRCLRGLSDGRMRGLHGLIGHDDQKRIRLQNQFLAVSDRVSLKVTFFMAAQSFGHGDS